MNSGNQQISYTAFHKADTIHNDSNQRLVIDYGVDNQRTRTRFYDNDQLQKTKYFAASYEKEVSAGNTREINYISTPYGTLAAYIVESGRGQMYYLYKDTSAASPPSPTPPAPSSSAAPSTLGDACATPTTGTTPTFPT